MGNTSLQKLLTEYEHKKANAEYQAQIKKQEVYQTEPQLQKIDDELSSLAISTTKSLILNNDSSLIKILEEKINILKMQKKQILESLNMTLDDFKPHYECSICKDTGYVTNNSHTTMCTCLKQKLFDEEYNKSNIQQLATQNFSSFSELLYSDEINEEKYHAKISPRENIKRILKIAHNFIEQFDSPETNNLLFTGNTGLGKTFLSSCIANELLKKHKNVLYQTAPIMLDSIVDYRFGKSNFEKSMYDHLLNVDLLIIDDLGTEYMNNVKFTELFNIINGRLLNSNHTVKTIISTNLSLNNLYNTYDERIVSRIVGNYTLCYFFGDDIRFKKR